MIDDFFATRLPTIRGRLTNWWEHGEQEHPCLLITLPPDPAAFIPDTDDLEQWWMDVDWIIDRQMRVIDHQTYSLAFTCKPNECEQFQLFVLFAPDGSKAWALEGSPLTGVNWFGEPDDRIRAAITAALQK